MMVFGLRRKKVFMTTIEVFHLLPVGVQLVLASGGIALLFLLACSRSAGDNLLAFLRGCYSLFGQKPKRWVPREARQHVSVTQRPLTLRWLPKGSIPQARYRSPFITSSYEGDAADD